MLKRVMINYTLDPLKEDSYMYRFPKSEQVGVKVEYIIKKAIDRDDPLYQRSTYGWKFRLNNSSYGDYVVITDDKSTETDKEFMEYIYNSLREQINSGIAIAYSDEYLTIKEVFKMLLNRIFAKFKINHGRYPIWHRIKRQFKTGGYWYILDWIFTIAVISLLVMIGILPELMLYITYILTHI